MSGKGSIVLAQYVCEYLYKYIPCALIFSVLFIAICLLTIAQLNPPMTNEYLRACRIPGELIIV